MWFTKPSQLVPPCFNAPGARGPNNANKIKDIVNIKFNIFSKFKILTGHEEVKINETNDDTVVDMNEEFYTFFWVPKKMNKGKNFTKKDVKSKKQKSKLSPVVRSNSSHRAKKNNKSKEKQIDPDNPFAQALMGFKKEN